jgi:hypothetical protein
MIDELEDDQEVEVPTKTTVRKADDSDETEDDEKAAARKADNEDTEVERTKLTPKPKVTIVDGPDARRKIIKRKMSTAARRLARGPVAVKRSRLVKRSDAGQRAIAMWAPSRPSMETETQ